MAFQFDIDDLPKKVKKTLRPLCKAVCPVFNQAKDKSCDLFKKGKYQTAIWKLMYEIAQDEKSMNRLFAEAGKLSYQDQLEGNAAEAFAQQCELIKKSEAELAALKDQVADLKAKMDEIDEAAAARDAEGYECTCSWCEDDEEEVAEETAPAAEEAAPAAEAEEKSAPKRNRRNGRQAK